MSQSLQICPKCPMCPKSHLPCAKLLCYISWWLSMLRAASASCSQLWMFLLCRCDTNVIWIDRHWTLKMLWWSLSCGKDAPISPWGREPRAFLSLVSRLNVIFHRILQVVNWTLYPATSIKALNQALSWCQVPSCAYPTWYGSPRLSILPPFKPVLRPMCDVVAVVLLVTRLAIFSFSDVLRMCVSLTCHFQPKNFPKIFLSQDFGVAMTV